MEIMDPYTSELLAASLLPGAFSGCGAAHQTAEFDDDYLRAIGALSRRSRADFASASVDHHAALEPSSVMLQAPCEQFAFAAAHSAQPAVEVFVQQPEQRDRKRAAPASDAANTKNSAAKRPRTCPCLPDYDADVDFNLREKERKAKQQPSPDYLKTVQGDRLDERTRTNLVLSMDEFARHYRLAPGTLHRAVSYVDRVLSVRTLSTADSDYELRLLGAAAVFTAAKYEERSTIFKLNAKDIAGYYGFATSKDVTDMEREVLATLRYELSGPTAYTFVDHFTRNSRGEKNMEIRRLAHHLADTSLVDYGCLQFLPSGVAATALFLARRILNPADSQEYFEDLTGYKPTDVIEGIQSLFRANPNSCLASLPVLRQYL